MHPLHTIVIIIVVVIIIIIVIIITIVIMSTVMIDELMVGVEDSQFWALSIYIEHHTHCCFEKQFLSNIHPILI